MERWALRRALAARPLLPPTPLSAAALCGPSPPGRAPTAVNPGLTRPPPARPGSAPAPTLPPLRLSQSRSGNPQRCSRPPRSSTNQRGEPRGAAPSRRALLSQSERSVSARSRRAAQPIRRGSLPLPPTARSQPIGGHGGGGGGSCTAFPRADRCLSSLYIGHCSRQSSAAPFPDELHCPAPFRSAQPIGRRYPAGGAAGAVSHSPLPGNALLGDGGLLPGNGASWARLRACADVLGCTRCTRRHGDGCMGMGARGWVHGDARGWMGADARGCTRVHEFVNSIARGVRDAAPE